MLQCDPVICQAATCAGNEKAVCRVNPCGKCRAEFLDEYGRLVQCEYNIGQRYFKCLLNRLFLINSFINL